MIEKDLDQIKEMFFKIKEVKEILIDETINSPNTIISIFVDMPQYDDKLMDKLVDTKLGIYKNYTHKYMDFRYLPINLVDPKDYTPINEPFDRQRALDLAEEFGIQVSFDNLNPSVTIHKEDGTEEFHKFEDILEDIFPEFKDYPELQTWKEKK